MKLAIVAVASMGLAGGAFAAKNSVDFSKSSDKLSYTLGADIGKNFKRQNIEINPEAMLQGLNDVFQGKPTRLTDEQMKETLQQFQKQLIEKRLAEFKSMADKNKKAGEDFLSTNKSKPGVVVLDSGLQYKVVTKGSGQKPNKEDSVKVEYTGKLINGKVFDSTDKSGNPATFRLDQVIPGWTEALQLMPVGSTWEVYVPSDLAYGARGFGREIGPNETLIFTIKLLAIADDKKA